MPAIPTHRGARTGTRIAHIISRSIVATHTKLLHVKHKLAMMVFHAISDEISDEVDDTLGPIFAWMHEQYGDEGPASDILRFMATGKGQLKALVGQGLAQSGILWSLSTILNDLLTPVVSAALENSPHLLPDASTIAQLAGTNRIDDNLGVSNLAKTGFNSSWAEWMIDANRSYVDPASGLDMLRRGIIDEGTFTTWAAKNGFTPPQVKALLALKEVPLSPADAALAFLRGNLDEKKALAAAAQWGVSKETFNVLVGNTGEPLALMQLLEAFRRGFIDEATLRRGILQSRVRDEWIDTAIKLRYTPISVADAVQAAVQNHISQDQAAKYADQNGLEPGAFDILYQTAGSPAARTEMEELYNRGLVSEAQVKQALRESRLKNKYVDDVFQLHVRLIEPRQLSAAVRVGAITHDDAVKRAMDAGYSRDDATILVNEGISQRLLTYKDRVISGVVTLYEDNLISQADAVSSIKGLGHEDSEVTYILKAAEFRREARMITTVVSAIRSKYVGHHIPLTQASKDLEAIGVPTQQRNALLDLWTLEQAANVRNLTEAQIAKAVKLTLIKPQEGLDRLVALGYDPKDAVLLLEGA